MRKVANILFLNLAYVAFTSKSLPFVSRPAIVLVLISVPEQVGGFLPEGTSMCRSRENIIDNDFSVCNTFLGIRQLKWPIAIVFSGAAGELCRAGRRFTDPA